MMNKKGSIVDIAFLLVTALGLGIFLLIVGYVFPQITSQIGDSDIGTLNSSMSALNTTDTVAGSGNMIFLTVFIGCLLYTSDAADE